MSFDKSSAVNNFGLRHELPPAAFDAAAITLLERLRDAMHGRPRGIARVRAILDFYATIGEQAFICGCCPLLNTAIEANDRLPTLVQHTRTAMDGWRTLVGDALDAAVNAGEVRSETDTDAVAALLVGMLEGGIFFTRLYGDRGHLRAVAAHLGLFVDALARQPLAR